MKTRDKEDAPNPRPSPVAAGGVRHFRTPLPDTLGRAELGDLLSSPTLASVTIDHAALDVHVADLGLNSVHLTLGRDENSGLIVAVALDAERRSPREALRLFGTASPATKEAGGLGAIWACAGMPEAIVVDHGTDYGDAAFREAATGLGIQVLHRPPRALPNRSHLERLLGRFGACRNRRGQGVVTMAMLVGAVHAWIATCYERPCGSWHVPPRPPTHP